MPGVVGIGSAEGVELLHALSCQLNCPYGSINIDKLSNPLILFLFCSFIFESLHFAGIRRIRFMQRPIHYGRVTNVASLPAADRLARSHTRPSRLRQCGCRLSPRVASAPCCTRRLNSKCGAATAIRVCRGSHFRYLQLIGFSGS
jgi:hypothetical protein